MYGESHHHSHRTNVRRVSPPLAPDLCTTCLSLRLCVLCRWPCYSLYFPGLSLKLCVQQFKYIPVSHAAGVRLVVHDQTSMPFPEDDGVSSAPRTKTFVGVRRVSGRHNPGTIYYSYYFLITVTFALRCSFLISSAFST